MAKLSKDDIREIVRSFNAGTHVMDLAREFEVDHSTINYHVTKYKDAELYDGDIYSLVKYTHQHECIHPSTKCLCCGKLTDTIRREERLVIVTLRTELAEANRLLGRKPVETHAVQ